MESELSIGVPPSQIDLLQKCDEIINCFSMAKAHLSATHLPPFDYSHHQLDMAAIFGKGKEIAEASMKADSGGQHKQRRGIEVGGSSSSAQLRSPRRSSRNDDQEGNKRVKVPAPQIGNTEMPPEDGFTWRKYGQKEILNAKYPRSYYRCTHQKLYNCQAKKQVQRLDEDPSTFDILYRGKHSCYTSNTAPSSIPPPPSSSIQDIFVSHHQPITTVGSSPFHWLSIDLTRASSEGAAGTLFDPQQQQPLFRVSSSNSVLGDHNGRDHHPAIDLLNNQPLLDWTDVFNSGSSSSNSMEVIFPPADDKKD